MAPDKGQSRETEMKRKSQQDIQNKQNQSQKSKSSRKN